MGVLRKPAKKGIKRALRKLAGLRRTSKLFTAEQLSKMAQIVKQGKLPPIPKFASTEEALKFGLKATKKQKVQLQYLREITHKQANELINIGQFDEAMKLATEAQLYREALQAHEIVRSQLPKGAIGAK